MTTMDSEGPGEIILSAKELYYVVSLLGEKSLPNGDMEAFILKSSGSDVDAKIWQEGREQLISRGCILPGPDGEFHISVSLLSVISHMLLANKAYMLQYTVDGREYEELQYISETRIIRMECLGKEEGQYRVTDLNIDEGERIYSFEGTEQKLKNPGELPALLLSRSQFAEIVSQAQQLEIEELMLQLSNTTDDQESVIALARCIKSNTSSGSLRFYSWDEHDWEVQSVKFINNYHMNWLLRTSVKEDEDWMIATPTSMENIQEMIRDWCGLTSHDIQEQV